MEHCFVPVLVGRRVSDKVNPPQSGQFHLQVADQSLHHGIHHVGVVAFVCCNEGIRGRRFVARDVFGRQPSTVRSSLAFHKDTCCALCPGGGGRALADTLEDSQRDWWEGGFLYLLLVEVFHGVI